MVLMVCLRQRRETFSIAVGWRRDSPASPLMNSHKDQHHPNDNELSPDIADEAPANP